MGRGKKYQPEQGVNLVRQIEVAIANGKTTAFACKETGIVEQMGYGNDSVQSGPFGLGHAPKASKSKLCDLHVR
jgi:hypothetical protein